MPAPTDGEAEQAPDPPAADRRNTTNSSGLTDRFGEYLPGRREAMFLAGGALVGALFGAGGVSATHRETAPPQRDDSAELTPKEARERLEAGNARFASGKAVHPDLGLGRRQDLAEAQHPFAAVLSCADSRVDPEALFDQGLGDLFVVRTAGQVVDDVALGSLQYGVEHLGVCLVVVLGHSHCGAVKATIEALDGGKPTGTAIDSLVAAITPAVKEARKLNTEGEEELEVAVHLNVENAVDQMKEAPVIGDASSRREIKILGAVYDLATGEVEWL